ncbi:putative 3-hydroxyanthranilate 3,4-dioxygenase [Seiridium cardinale]
MSENTIPPPLQFAQWLGQNEAKLQPPVNNYCLYSGNDFVLMAVGGPNERNDFHVNETEEWFYQLKGAMLLRIVENGAFRDVHIREGEMFMLPGRMDSSLPLEDLMFPSLANLGAVAST